MSKRLSLIAAGLLWSLAVLPVYALTESPLPTDATAPAGEPGAVDTPGTDAGITVTDLMDTETTAAWPEPVLDNTYHSPICPPVEAAAMDRPDDTGGVVRLEWRPCPKEGAAVPTEYWILRSTDHGPFTHVGSVHAGEHLETRGEGDKAKQVYVYDDEGLSDSSLYSYRVLGRDGERVAYAFTAGTDGPLADLGPVSPSRQMIPYAERASLRGALTVAVPTDVIAKDRPDDAGDVIQVSWTASPGIEGVPGSNYRIYRAESPEGDYALVGTVGASKTEFEDNTSDLWEKSKKAAFSYVVAATDAGGVALAVSDHSAEPARATLQVVDLTKWNFVFFGALLSGFIIYFIQHIKSGKKLFVRKIAGLEAVEESIGRATEMGKPVLYIPGILDMNDVMTVAGIVILGRIARQVAEYDTKLLCPTSKSLVMTTGRETVKEAFISAGRPDAYNDDIVTYLTDEQFGYVAGVNGIMVREKPATCLYFGAFFAESLILAETGNSIGAIQIAGTAQAAQLPFFIAACDYTLIGEELFAASAYLSHDPKQLGSLKGQDVGKVAGMVGIVAGSVFATIAHLSGAGWAQAVVDLFMKLFQPVGG